MEIAFYTFRNVALLSSKLSPDKKQYSSVERAWADWCLNPNKADKRVLVLDAFDQQSNYLGEISS